MHQVAAMLKMKSKYTIDSPNLAQPSPIPGSVLRINGTCGFPPAIYPSCSSFSREPATLDRLSQFQVTSETVRLDLNPPVQARSCVTTSLTGDCGRTRVRNESFTLRWRNNQRKSLSSETQYEICRNNRSPVPLRSGKVALRRSVT